MKQFKKTPSSIAAPFLIAKASDVGEILPACPHDIKILSAYLLPGVPRKPASGLLYSLSFIHGIDGFLKKKFGYIKQFLKAGSEVFFLGSGIIKPSDSSSLICCSCTWIPDRFLR